MAISATVTASATALYTASAKRIIQTDTLNGLCPSILFFFSSLGQHGEEERAELGLGKLAQDHLELAIEVNYYANNYFWLHYSSREALSLDFRLCSFCFCHFFVFASNLSAHALRATARSR